jgi:hypothetical protein
MGLLDDLNLQRNTGEGSYLRQQFPRVYGLLGGLLGTAPDEFEGSVMDPQSALVRAGAELGYLPGLLAGALPTGKVAGLGAMVMGATRGSGYSKIPAMLDDLARTYQQTGQVAKLAKVPAVVLSPAEQEAFNAARRGLEPRLTAPELGYRGNHHFNSRGPTLDGNGYNNTDLMQQLDSVSSQNLGLSVGRTGPSFQVQRPRVDAYGKSVKDRMVVNVDQSGRGELFSIIPEGDGLQKGQKVPVTPLGSGDQARPVSDGIRKSVSTEPLLGSTVAQPAYSPQYQAAIDAGLDMSYEARMQRAKQQGFEPLFHGTNSDVPAFTQVNGGNMWGRGTYLTDSTEDASKYATGWHNRITPDGNAGPNVMPLMAHGRFLDMDAPVKAKDIAALSKLSDLQLKDYLFSNKGRDVLQTLNEQTVEGANHWLQMAKFDGLKGAGSNTPAGGAGSVQTVFNPANIRSVNAAFNPANIGEADLLGRVDPNLLPWLAGGGLLSGAYLNQDK